MFVFSLNFLYFLLIIIILTFSGNFFLKLIKLKFESFLANCLFSLFFALVAITLLAYLLLFLGAQFLVIPIFWFFMILGIFNIFYLISKKRFSTSSRIDFGLTLVVLILTILMSSITVRSGWLVDGGLEFVGINAIDGIFHLSWIAELKNHFPPEHPNFSGVEFRGYHYLLDLLLAKFSLVFGFSETDLYFRFFPLLIAASWCLATFLLAQKYFKNKRISYLTVIFSIFGGGFAYFLPIFHPGEMNLDSTFGVSSPISSLLNLPFSFSIPLLALTFYAFLEFLKSKSFGWGLVIAIFTGSLFGLKIYSGMIVLFALGLSSVYLVLKERKFKNIWVAFLSGVFGILVYLPIRIQGAGLVFAPGELAQSVIRGPLSWTLWELRRQVYAEHNNLFGLFRMESLTYLVFIFGNLGTKALGLMEIFKFKKESILTKYFGLFFFALLFSFLVPLLFIQSITPFNIVQFWWYFLYLMSFLMAAFTWDFLKDKQILIKSTLLALIIILTIPSAVVVLNGYLFPKSFVKILPSQLRATKFLKDNSNPDDVVLEIPAISTSGELSFGLALIPALAQRRLFMGSEMIDFPYLDKNQKVKEIRKIIAPLNCREKISIKRDNCEEEITLSLETSEKNNIDYVFSSRPLFWLEENSKISSLIYNNEGSFIYKLNK